MGAGEALERHRFRFILYKRKRVLYLFTPPSSSAIVSCSRAAAAAEIDNPIRRNQKSSSNRGREEQPRSSGKPLSPLSAVRIDWICHSRLNGMICFPSPEHFCARRPRSVILFNRRLLLLPPLLFRPQHHVLWICALHRERRYFIKWRQIFSLVNSGAFNKKAPPPPPFSDRPISLQWHSVRGVGWRQGGEVAEEEEVEDRTTKEGRHKYFNPN